MISVETQRGYFVVRGTAEEIIEFAAVLKRGMRLKKVESRPETWAVYMNVWPNLTEESIKIAIRMATTQGVGYGKIEAIKYLRSELGCGLKEAKDMVESWI